MKSNETEGLASIPMTALKLRLEAAQPAETVETVTLGLYSDLAEVLAPVIGDVGVQALESRALHITRQIYGPSTPREAAPSTKTAEPLRDWLRQLEPDIASEAAGSLLTTLTTLLASFIGGGLTMRLEQKAWTNLFSESESSESKEIDP